MPTLPTQGTMARTNMGVGPAALRIVCMGDLVTVALLVGAEAAWPSFAAFFAPSHTTLDPDSPAIGAAFIIALARCAATILLPCTRSWTAMVAPLACGVALGVLTVEMLASESIKGSDSEALVVAILASSWLFNLVEIALAYHVAQVAAEDRPGSEGDDHDGSLTKTFLDVESGGGGGGGGGGPTEGGWTGEVGEAGAALKGPVLEGSAKIANVEGNAEEGVADGKTKGKGEDDGESKNGPSVGRLVALSRPEWPMMGLATAALVLATLAGLATPSFFGVWMATHAHERTHNAHTRTHTHARTHMPTFLAISPACNPTNGATATVTTTTTATATTTITPPPPPPPLLPPLPRICPVPQAG